MDVAAEIDDVLSLPTDASLASPAMSNEEVLLADPIEESQAVSQDVVPHSAFFFENDLVEIHVCVHELLRLWWLKLPQVGGVAFKVHAHLFTRESEKAEAFIMSKHDNPSGIISLEDITAIDFERFLTILYSKYVPSRRKR
jgi:hypothetical protein